MEEKYHNRESGDVEPTEPPAPITTYNDTVMDHFMNPRNLGEMTEEEADGSSAAAGSSCDDRMKLWIKVESGKIIDIKYKCVGCPGAIATTSIMTVLVKGKPLEEAKQLTGGDVDVALGGLPEQRKHCALLGIGALHDAVKSYEQKLKENEKKIIKRRIK